MHSHFIESMLENQDSYTKSYVQYGDNWLKLQSY